LGWRSKGYVATRLITELRKVFLLVWLLQCMLLTHF
jgi:hypothetical protein